MHRNETELFDQFANAEKKGGRPDGMEFATEAGVRRVIRRIGTDRFLKATGDDTTQFENGKTFNGFADALDFCTERGLKGVELVLLDSSGQEQVCITIT